MANWEKDFPQPPAAPQGAASRVSVAFDEPERHQIEVQLTHPLRVDGERVASIIVRRITAKQMVDIVEAADAPSNDQQLTRHVVAAMCGQPPEVLDGLFPDDAWRVAEAATPFMPGGLRAALERPESPEETGGAPD